MSEKRIALAKGIPILNWIGKKGIGNIRSFPTQLMQVNDPTSTIESADLINFDHIKDSWFNLLFHGDNREILATLLENGFRGKIDLIYIDPPFKSGADYVRRVALRGFDKTLQIESGETSVIQQTMYFDIWNNDNYLQFMYERLILMKELLSETGNFFLHLDWRMCHYLRIILDEIFGSENFRNEIIWFYPDTPGRTESYFPRKHDNILWYSKTNNYYFNADNVRVEILEASKKRYESPRTLGGRTYTGGKSAIKGKVPEDVWRIPSVKGTTKESMSFATQKPEKLISRIIKACSKPGDLIADLFVGSGTTLATAQKLNRRWIGSDINKGSLQITSKRIQDIIESQIKEKKTEILAFATYKVNDYDLKLLKTEAIELAMRHVGVQRTTNDRFFEGTIGNNTLVKIIDLNHPLTLLDLSLLSDELDRRPTETRDIFVICLGKESKVDFWIEEWNKKQPFSDVRKRVRVRQMKVIELRTDNKYGKFFTHTPSSAEIIVKRSDDEKAIITITSFISPTVIDRFSQENKIYQPKIHDFRSMIDSIFIDNNYNEKIFNVKYSDIPQKSSETIEGKYEIEVQKKQTKVAIMIIDVLGEELLVVKDI